MTTREQTGSNDELVVVCQVQGMLVAQVIKGKLASVGIPALLKYESLGPVFGITVNGLGNVKVLVPKAREQAARQALAEDKETG